ncbi:MAG TPA: class I lanthipeptide [Thermoanaerobaculia bacterium]
MKKQTKKLVLAKETLTSLEKNGLGRVAGGVSANTDCTDTNCCSGLAGCGSTYCHETSGSRLC